MATQPGLPCPFSGEERLGDMRGHVVSINSRNAYVSEAAGNYIHADNAIIFFTDANGLNYASAMLADQFAAAGYLTLVTEWTNKFAPMDGQEPPQFTMTYTPATVHPLPPDERDTLIRDTVDYLQNTRKITGDLGVVAYGEGLNLAMRLLTRNAMKATSGNLNNVNYVGFIADPGTMTLREIDSRSAPLGIALGDQATQTNFPLQEHLKAQPSPYQLTTYSYVQDGFAVRRAVTSEAELFFKKQAFVQAITWMNEFLLDGAPLILTENPIHPKTKSSSKPAGPQTGSKSGSKTGTGSKPGSKGSKPGSQSGSNNNGTTNPQNGQSGSTNNGTDNPQNGQSGESGSSHSSTSSAEYLTEEEIENIKNRLFEEEGLKFVKLDSGGYMIFQDEAGNLFDVEGEAVTTPATQLITTPADPAVLLNNQIKYTTQNVEVRAYDNDVFTDTHGNYVGHDQEGYYDGEGIYFKPRAVTRIHGPGPKASPSKPTPVVEELDMDDSDLESANAEIQIETAPSDSEEEV